MRSFNLDWKDKNIVVGKREHVLVNQLVGSNTKSDYCECIKKIDMWDESGSAPDIITDVSIGRTDEKMPIWRYVLDKGKYIVGRVPIYSFHDRKTIEKVELLDEIEIELQSGVKIITIHPTPNKQLIDLSHKRIVPFTSRGGAIVIRDLISNSKKQNIYYESLDEIIAMCKIYGAAISLGTSFRPANIIDSMDETQIIEIKQQIELAEYINKKGAKVILEMPGHVSPKKIQMLNQMLENCNYPIMPLGPVVTDVGVGMDHITSAIGLTLMGLKNNVQIIAAMSAEEHTGSIPSVDSTKEAVLTARMVAHILDMEKFQDYSLDYKYALERRYTCIAGRKKAGCSRCGMACPLNYSTD